MRAEEITALETMLGHHFLRPELLEQALTHSSHAHEQETRGPGAALPRDNEQLEFLGDAVLGFVTGQELFERFPHFHEGQLSKTRAHLVSAKHLVEVADELGLGRYLRLGRGEEKSGGRGKAALLVNALEAVLAAIYLDAGLEKVRAFILQRIVNPELEGLDKAATGAFPITDHKSALQELLQASGRPQPSYTVVGEEGPEHKKIFTVEVRIQGDGRSEYVSRAQGATKKKAEQRAARQALEHLQGPVEEPRGARGGAA